MSFVFDSADDHLLTVWFPVKQAAYKLEALFPVVSRKVCKTFSKVRAKMLGYRAFDCLNLLAIEFAAPETEDGWKKRQTLLAELSKLLSKRKDHQNDNLPKDFVERAKAVLPEIVVTAASERTTLSNEALKATTQLAIHLRDQLQSHIDIILPNLIAICGSTKSVTRDHAFGAANTICAFAGYNPRLFYHVCAAFNDKRNSVRALAPFWLETLILFNPNRMDKEKDGAIVHKAIIQGLTDRDATVRDNSRTAYWAYYQFDNKAGRIIMASLNAHAQNALRNHQYNPEKLNFKEPIIDPADTTIEALKARSRRTMSRITEQSQRIQRNTVPSFSEDVQVQAPEATNASQQERPLLSAPVRRRPVVATPLASGPLPLQKAPIGAEAVPAAVEITAQSAVTQGASGASKERQPTSSGRVSTPQPTKDLLTAMKGLGNRKLDVLGYRRLKQLISTYPGLINSQQQFNELFELLIFNMTTFDETLQDRSKPAGDLNHPAYNRLTILIIINMLMEQYPQWPEPHAGMVLGALLIARCNHNQESATTLDSIDELAFMLCDKSDNTNAAIDAVHDTLEAIELLITGKETVFTPTTNNIMFLDAFESLASDFGQAERAHFAPRLPIVMDFGLKILVHLLRKLARTNQSLTSKQEDHLAAFAERLLSTYSSEIKRTVVNFCATLHGVIKTEKSFYANFSNDSHKNLIQYYAKVGGSQN